MKTAKILFMLASFLLSYGANADEIVSGCVKDKIHGQVCPREPLGTVVIDLKGDPKCAPGQCAIDAAGNAICSSSPGGTVVLDLTNTPSCQGRCIRPSASFCEKLG
jgi:hypothetical protein